MENKIVNTKDFIEGFEYKKVKIEDFDYVEMTGEVEEAIAKNEIKRNGGKVVRKILEMCITRLGEYTKETMKANEWTKLIQSMPVSEQDYALLMIRESSLGDEIEIEHECPHCKQKLHSIIGTDELEIVQFNGIKEIEFELPKGYKTKDGKCLKKGIIVRPTGEDREVLDPIVRKNFGLANTILLSRCVKDLEGEKVTDRTIRQLAIRDREYLLTVLKENTYGVKVDGIEFTCSKCGETFEGSLNASNFI